MGRTFIWLVFFGFILAAWWWLCAMATEMKIDLVGRPDDRARVMAAMDPCMT